MGYIAPTVAAAAAASQSTVTGTTVNLSARGAVSVGSEADLTYTWSAKSYPDVPVDPPSFSANGTNLAKNTTVTFNTEGDYVFEVSMANGTSTITSDVTLTVSQVATGITLGGLDFVGATLQSPTQFEAGEYDQFGLGMDVQPSFTWSIDDASLATMATGGLLTPSTTHFGVVTVEASDSAHGLIGQEATKVGTQWSDNGPSILTFPNSSLGAGVTTQYPGITFSSDSPHSPVVVSNSLSGPSDLGWGNSIPTNFPNFTKAIGVNDVHSNPTLPVYVDFATPASNVLFGLHSRNEPYDPDNTLEAQINVYQDGVYKATIPVYSGPVNLLGNVAEDGSYYKIAIPYSSVTRLEIVENNHLPFDRAFNPPNPLRDQGMEVGYFTAVPEHVNFTAFRSGDNFGQPVSNTVKQSGDPSQYVNLVNDNFDQQLSGGAPDYSNDTAPIQDDINFANAGLPLPDPDFGELVINTTLAGISDGGTLQLQVSDQNAVKFFNDNGNEITLAALTGDLTNGRNGGVPQDIWFEGIKASSNLVFTLTFTDAHGVVQSSDSIHTDIVDWKFVGTDGNQMTAAEPVWKDALIAAATAPGGALQNPTGANGPDASNSFFRSQFIGLAGGSSPQLRVTSQDDPADTYNETLVSGNGGLVQSHYNILYNGNMYLSTDDSPLTDSQRAAIQNGLSLDAVHNPDGISMLTTAGGQFTRKMQVPEEPTFAFTSDVVNVGGQIQGTLAIPAQFQSWIITIQEEGVPSIIQTAPGNSMVFSFAANNVGYFSLSVSVTAPTAPMGIPLTLDWGQLAEVDVLPAGKTMSTWSARAWAALHVNGLVQGDSVARSRQITKLYSAMFDLGPPIPFLPSAENPYEWFGLAAFAAKRVGDGMAKALSIGFKFPFTPDPMQVYSALGQGNLAIYMNMYPEGL